MSLPNKSCFYREKPFVGTVYSRGMRLEIIAADHKAILYNSENECPTNISLPQNSRMGGNKYKRIEIEHGCAGSGQINAELHREWYLESKVKPCVDG